MCEKAFRYASSLTPWNDNSDFASITPSAFKTRLFLSAAYFHPAIESGLTGLCRLRPAHEIAPVPVGCRQQLAGVLVRRVHQNDLAFLQFDAGDGVVKKRIGHLGVLVGADATSTGYAFKPARRSIETSKAALSRQTPYFLSKVMHTSCGSKPAGLFPA